MKKQIFAIVLVTVLIVGLFAACGKKYMVYTDEDGVAHALLTDTEGNTMVNDFGQLVAGVTDDRGKLVTDADGNYETRAVAFPSLVIYGSTYETPDFKLTVPERLWSVSESGLTKKDSEIRVEIGAAPEPTSLDEQAELNEQFIALLKKNGVEVNAESQRFRLQNGVEVLQYSVDINSETESLKEHREVFSFRCNETMYTFTAIEPEAERGTVSYIDLLNMIKFR